MKKTVILLFLSVLSVLFCSCSKDDYVPADMQKVDNPNADYTLYVPDDWKIDLTTGVSSAVYESDRTNLSVTAFNLEGDDTYMTCDSYWEKFAADCRTTFTDFRYLTEDEAQDGAQISDADAGVSVTLGMTQAKKYAFSMNVTGTEYHYCVVICIRGGYAYMLTYTALPDYYETHLEQFDSVIKNFAFDD